MLTWALIRHEPMSVVEAVVPELTSEIAQARRSGITTAGRRFPLSQARTRRHDGDGKLRRHLTVGSVPRQVVGRISSISKLGVVGSARPSLWRHKERSQPNLQQARVTVKVRSEYAPPSELQRFVPTMVLTLTRWQAFE